MAGLYLYKTREMKKYKVRFFQDNAYEVFERKYEGINWTTTYPPITTSEDIPVETWTKVFQGTLPECEAWINLHTGGYME